MPPPDRLPLRLVVQRVSESPSRQPTYRLIAYSNEHTYRPVQFATVDEVLKAVKAILPQLDPNLFYQGSREATSIVFAESVELSQEQLSVLGLKK